MLMPMASPVVVAPAELVPMKLAATRLSAVVGPESGCRSR